MNGIGRFRSWGWCIVLALFGFNGVMINDLFFVPRGQHGVLARWHGAPWPLVLLMAAPLAHLWLLLSVWVVGVRGSASLRDMGRLMSALALSIAVFHALIWDNGALLRRWFS